MLQYYEAIDKASTLHLQNVPKNFRRKFAGNREDSLEFANGRTQNSFNSFSEMNQHIKILKLSIELDEIKFNYYSEIIYNLIIENLTQLKVLRLYYGEGNKYGTFTHAQVYRLQTIDTFSFKTAYSNTNVIKSFEFDNLIKITIDSLDSHNMDNYIDILLRNENLQIVKFKCGFRLKTDEIDRFQIVLHQLPELKEIVISITKRKRLEDTKEIVGSEWKLVLMIERPHDKLIKISTHSGAARKPIIHSEEEIAEIIFDFDKYNV